jgi:hypothetical protein
MGTPPPGYDGEWVTHTMHCHGFGSLPSEQDEFVDSPEFMLLGNQWLLRVFPGGDDDEDAEEGMVSLELWNKSDKSIKIYYGFSVNNGNGKQVAYGRSDVPRTFSAMGDADEDDHWGFTYFAKLSDLLRSLVNGTLVIEVHMRLATPTKSVPPPFIPENPVAKMIQGLFLNDKSSDIIFEVAEGKGKNSAMKVTKTAPVTFAAHRVIVENSSTVFADLCESHDDSAPTPIQINDVTPDIFRLLLSYTYGVKVSENDLKLHAKEVIDAADKYGVISLKLEAEACFVEGTTFTIENVMEHLLYADSKNLALLKEAAMDFILENKSEVIKKMSFVDLVPGTFVRDVLVATARGERNVGGAEANVDNQYDSLRISELRMRGHEKGLNVDGSREMLIAALKTVQELEPEVGLDDGSEESDEEPEED